jgi:GNAT superfamily N-acetyltransferase
MSVAVRLAGSADLIAALGVWQRGNVARGKVADQGRIQRVRAKLADRSAVVLVAVSDCVVVEMGFAEPGDGRPELCHISMVFVDPDHWGEWVGGVLLDAPACAAVVRTATWSTVAARYCQEPAGASRLLAGSGRHVRTASVTHQMNCYQQRLLP